MTLSGSDDRHLTFMWWLVLITLGVMAVVATRSC